MRAACELYANWFNKGEIDDSENTAYKLARQVAADQGFVDG